MKHFTTMSYNFISIAQLQAQSCEVFHFFVCSFNIQNSLWPPMGWPRRVNLGSSDLGSMISDLGTKLLELVCLISALTSSIELLNWVLEGWHSFRHFDEHLVGINWSCCHGVSFVVASTLSTVSLGRFWSRPRGDFSTSGDEFPLLICRPDAICQRWRVVIRMLGCYFWIEIALIPTI